MKHPIISVSFGAYASLNGLLIRHQKSIPQDNSMLLSLSCTCTMSSKQPNTTVTNLASILISSMATHLHMLAYHAENGLEVWSQFNYHRCHLTVRLFHLDI